MPYCPLWICPDNVMISLFNKIDALYCLCFGQLCVHICVENNWCVITTPEQIFGAYTDNRLIVHTHKLMLMSANFVCMQLVALVIFFFYWGGEADHVR